MNVPGRWYIGGYIMAAVLSVLGELVWLGDPIRWGDLYWIDLLQGLAALVVLVPLAWAAGALSGLAGLSGGQVVRAIRLLIAICGIGTAVLLVADASRLLPIAGAAAAACLLTLADLALTEQRSRPGWPRRSLSIAGVLLVAAAGLFWPTAYQVTSPGFTLAMNRYASVEGGQPHGSIAGVLVIERPAFPVDWLYASLFPHVRIDKRDTSVTIGESLEAAGRQRTDANTIAGAVALHKLGLGRGVVPDGVRVVQVPADSPAAGQLKPGDVVVEMNGQAIASTAALTEAMKGVTPGAEARLKVWRAGALAELAVRTKESGDTPKRTVFGIQVEDRVQADLTRKIGYRSYLVYQGGPSHGAVLALTLIDQLTPGGVTNGNRVAGTGTIGADGAVGRIGGIEQKAYAVERAGADVFFVPAGQEADARKGASELNIVPVRTLDEMLKWLAEHPASSLSRD
ncbi:PDZ domain-containing protein [Paenibacillus sp. UNCCL117]|uniref:PDZ domain-containing protein n=1 Tax=unclassified Paenibacillus TaxID=185978 RepID=UPI00088620F6|nr:MULTISPECIES: PDZ domain-containing protein [unclassified Paenibacillus]SDC63457.1 PDZ domain-containing protein [Paenibacillus sp. cl123]SFW22295.1 PDZ domain-containing protein [Paenibacillus sp. UNCCL117]